MFEATSVTETNDAIKRAHDARARVFAGVLRDVAGSFLYPMGALLGLAQRAWRMATRPQGCPEGS